MSGEGPGFDEKVAGHLHFISLLLSMAGAESSSQLTNRKVRDKKHVHFNLSIIIGVEAYNLCLDMALQRLIAEGE